MTWLASPDFPFWMLPLMLPCFFCLLAFPSLCETGVVQQCSTVALECSLPGRRGKRPVSELLSLVLSAICIPAGQPASHSVIERDTERESAGCCYVKSRHPLRPGLSLLTVAASPPSSVQSIHTTMPAQAWQAGTVRDGDDATVLRRWRRGRSSVSGVTVSLAASWDTPIRADARNRSSSLPSCNRCRLQLQEGSSFWPAQTAPWGGGGGGGGVARCNADADADAMCLRPPSMRSRVCLAPTPMLQVRFDLIYEQ